MLDKREWFFWVAIVFHAESVWRVKVISFLDEDFVCIRRAFGAKSLVSQAVYSFFCNKRTSSLILLGRIRPTRTIFFKDFRDFILGDFFNHDLWGMIWAELNIFSLAAWGSIYIGIWLVGIFWCLFAIRNTIAIQLPALILRKFVLDVLGIWVAEIHPLHIYFL